MKNVKIGQIIEEKCIQCDHPNKYKVTKIEEDVEYSDGKFRAYEATGMKGNCNPLEEVCRIIIKDNKDGWYGRKILK